MPIYRCSKCGAAYPQQHVACKHCGGVEFTRADSAGTGTLVTWTLIRKAPTAFAQEAPYVVVVAELDEGVRVTGRLAADAVDPEPGCRLELSAIRDGVPVFRTGDPP